MGKSLAESNPHLRDTDKRKQSMAHNIKTSSAIEGIKQTIKLLACPFCGEEEDVVLKAKYYAGGALEIRGLKFWRVECLPCDARTGNHFDGDAELLGYADGREAAAAAWNLRVD